MAPPKHSTTLVIGVDVGHECTKFAASSYTGGNGDQPRPVAFEWAPSRYTLPTIVKARWPNMVDSASETEHEIKRRFKLKALGLGEASDNEAIPSLSHHEARLLLSQFLRDLLPLIAGYYDTHFNRSRLLPTWEDIHVEFVFSVPSIAGVHGGVLLTKLAREAGFQTMDGKFKVLDVKLTEPEAAAIYAIKDDRLLLETGSTVLVLDVGGGTSDLSMVTMQKDGTCKLDKHVLVPVFSDRFGGSYVDEAIEASVKKHMQHLRGCDARFDPKYAANLICSDDGFLKAKSRLLDFMMPIPGVGNDASVVGTQEDDGIRIDCTHVSMRKHIFNRHLDTQLFGPGGEERRSGGIVGQVVAMRDDLFVRAPSLSEPYRKREGKGKDCPIEGDTLDAVIFTGGVCKSAHLQQKVKAALESNPPELEQMGINNVTRRTRYHVPDDSQVCVCKGLVYARLQEVSTTNDKWYKSFFDNLRI